MFLVMHALGGHAILGTVHYLIIYGSGAGDFASGAQEPLNGALVAVATLGMHGGRCHSLLRGKMHGAPHDMIRVTPLCVMARRAVATRMTATLFARTTWLDPFLLLGGVQKQKDSLN